MRKPLGSRLEVALTMKLIIVTQKVDATDSNLGFFVRWVEEFSKHADITVIANEVHKDAYGNIPKKVNIFSLGKEYGNSRFTRMRLYRKLLREQLPKADGIFFHMCPEYALGAYWLPKRFGVKSVLWYVHKQVSVRLRLARFLVDKIFTASKESCRLRSNKVEVVGHGIDTELFVPSPTAIVDPSKIRLLTVGRISPTKDIKTLILGFLELKKRLSIPMRFTILGKPLTEQDRAYERDLHAICKRSSPDQFVWSYVSHDAIVSLYTNNDYGTTVFVHASKTGSMDKAVLEALSAGLPVFSSSEAFVSVPGVQSFREGDPSDFAEKIATAFDKKELMLSEIGRTYVRKHHGLTALIDRIFTFYV